MSKILDFMNNYGKETTIKSMKDLIALYKEKIIRYINNYKKNNFILTQEEKTQIIMKMILKSFNAVVKSCIGFFFEKKKKTEGRRIKKNKKWEHKYLYLKLLI